MRVSQVIPLVSALSSVATATPQWGHERKICPKVMIVSMFTPEAQVWYGIPEFNLLEKYITTPGLSPLFPSVHCTKDEQICQVVLGESEINAASTVSALVLSPKFDLTKSYFLVAGIAGINPEEGTLADVTFARYAIQVALQYEFDYRDAPKNFSTGYFPQGSTNPMQYPQQIYGTEVFEFNDALRSKAMEFARQATLNDSTAAVNYRAKYAGDAKYTAALGVPSVRACDVATSDVYYSGTELGQAFSNYTKLVTNGTATYCTTAQEDNATAAVLVRAALAKLVDYTRLIVMRTGSDFERPYDGESALENLVYANQGAFDPAIMNIYLAGVKVVEGIVKGWDSVYEKGIKAENYVGDIFDSLPQQYKPDFGLPSQYLSAQTLGRRGLAGKKQRLPAMKITVS